MRVLRRFSISSRIAAGSLAVAILFAFVAVIVLRIGVASILHNATVTLLMNDAAPYVTALHQEPNDPVDEPAEGQLVAVIGPDGSVLESSLSRGLRPKTKELAALDGGAHEVTTSKAEYLVLTKHVEIASGSYRIITARNEETAGLVLDRLTIALLVGAIALVLAFGAASWLLARTALRPVSRMRLRAESIAEGASTGLLPVGPAQDELAALATTLNDLISRLRASTDREKQMVSDASHELRTPLAVLQGQLELAELDDGDPDALLDDIRSSRATVLRLSQLATNLLELSRIEAAAEAAEPGHADWRALTTELADAIDRARALPDVGDLSIDFDYAATGTGTVALSARDFGRILDNLLSNAVIAVGATGSVAAALSINDGRVVLTVVDSGPGMPEEFLPVALDRFTRADTARTSYSGGGLGLAIVAALVQAAGGTIALTNQEAGGLRVEIALPRSA